MRVVLFVDMGLSSRSPVEQLITDVTVAPTRGRCYPGCTAGVGEGTSSTSMITSEIGRTLDPNCERVVALGSFVEIKAFTSHRGACA